MSKKKDSKKDDELKITELGLPAIVSHLKPGNTLCTNGSFVVLQNGATTLEIRAPPKFEPKQIPWQDGLIRDIIWCSELQIFILLTKKGLFTFNPKSTDSRATPTTHNETQLKIKVYANVKPYDEKVLFWRCTCVGKKIYICYSGCATAIDEYTLEPTSCKLTNRWVPPQTCAAIEGIWCIRTDPDTNQIGMTIVNPYNNAWRFEIRDSKTFAHIWQMPLPIANGDCELTSLMKDEWLIVNSCGPRLIQIADLDIKYAVEYERELKNAINFKKDHFIVRTKNTFEVHVKKKEDD